MGVASSTNPGTIVEVLVVESAIGDSSQDDYERFLQHFSRDRDRLFAFIRSLVANQTDAEDIFQRCSLVLWRKFSAFRPDESFLAWACGIAHFEVRNHFRTSARDRLRFDNELVDQLAARRLETLGRRDDRLTALQTCLQRLTSDQRSLLDAAYGNGTIKDWAAASGRALQTAYNQLGRVRRQLLSCVRRKLASDS